MPWPNSSLASRSSAPPSNKACRSTASGRYWKKAPSNKSPHSALLDRATQRLARLRIAQQLLAETGFAGCTAAARQELTDTVARALKTGLTIAAMRPALQAAAGPNTGRVNTTLEDGESLHLTGVDEATVTLLMRDFIVRGLGRGKILRATGHVIAQHRQGVSGEQIRATLWQTASIAPSGQPQHRRSR